MEEDSVSSSSAIAPVVAQHTEPQSGPSSQQQLTPIPLLLPIAAVAQPRIRSKMFAGAVDKSKTLESGVGVGGGGSGYGTGGGSGVGGGGGGVARKTSVRRAGPSGVRKGKSLKPGGPAASGLARRPSARAMGM